MITELVHPNEVFWAPKEHLGQGEPCLSALRSLLVTSVAAHISSSKGYCKYSSDRQGCQGWQLLKENELIWIISWGMCMLIFPWKQDCPLLFFASPVHTIPSSTQMLDPAFPHVFPHQDAIRVLLPLGTLAEAKGGDIVTLRGKISGQYLQNSWSFIRRFYGGSPIKCLSKKVKSP